MAKKPPEDRLVAHLRDLGYMVSNGVKALPMELQLEWLDSFERRRKRKWLAWICWLPGLFYAYMGKWGTWALYLLSALIGIPALIWWIIQAINLNSTVDKHNTEVGMELLTFIEQVRRSQQDRQFAETPSTTSHG
ncbi:MAG: TM2 domain-containing protein [Thermoleophilia bacterium]